MATKSPGSSHAACAAAKLSMSRLRPALSAARPSAASGRWSRSIMSGYRADCGFGCAAAPELFCVGRERSRIDREDAGDGRAFVRRRVDQHPAFVQFDHGLHDRKAETRPAMARPVGEGLKPIEHPVDHFRQGCRVRDR